MRRSLPPLHALRAFEAAARHLSFSRAADELCVTQGAVSRQVQSLEDRLGLPLFRRLTRRVELTEEGRELLPVLSESFDRIAEAAARLSSSRGDLRLRVAFSFGIRWLMPRLARFRAAHPEFRVRVNVAFDSGPTLDPAEADAAIAICPSRPEGGAATELLGERLTVLCAPALARGLRAPADLARLPILHACAQGEDWLRWLRAAGVPPTGALGDALGRAAVFDAMDPALQAAAAGLGATVADRVLAAADIETGRLVAPFAEVEASSGSYWLVSPRGDGERPALSALREWLLAEARAGRARPSLPHTSPGE